MKRKIFMATILLSAVSMSILSGCKKVLDYIVTRPGGVAKICRIERITANHDTMWFDYNKRGDPVAIRYASTPPEDDIYTDDRAYKYDHQNRLVVFLEQAIPSAEDPSGALWWHKYTHVNKNLIVDTAFEYAQGDWKTSDRPEFGSDEAGTIVTTFILDNYGRVIREMGGIWNVDKTYSYDSNGNLVKPGVTYSNKINIRQTSRTWMFIDRDYSVNSPVGEASTFNSFGLPVKLDIMPLFVNGNDDDYRDVAVDYKCN
ncbi:MAG TPA: hypothetical protein PKV73_02330 [Agriterribacter sp.]|nr:hypothetical protein [Agriterribacter sp.]